MKVKIRGKKYAFRGVAGAKPLQSVKMGRDESAFDASLEAAVITALLTSYIIVWLLFAQAYFEPSRSVTVYIDRYGEAGLEAVMFAVSTACMAVYGARKLKNKEAK